MATIKIILPTYRRNETLTRSISSLLAQTFDDWICEIHNDDPEDNFPRQYIQKLHDQRFTVIDHGVNYGPVKTFNQAFKYCSEQYVSILEDDNWWEPDFLTTMYAVMNTHPQARMAWANMNLWQEQPNNKWVDLGNTIWPLTDKEVTVYDRPVYKQATDALHSNGAMLVRNTNLSALITPTNIRFDFIEHIRERIYGYPIIRVEKPLANFSVTIKTSRSNSIDGIFEHYLLLIDSYFKNFGCRESDVSNLWADARKGQIKTFNKLIYTGLICKNSRILLKQAKLSEWVYFMLYNIKHPTILFKCIKAKRNYSELWTSLLSAGRHQTNIK